MTGMALQWRTASACGAATFVRQPHYGRAASRATVRVHASFLNPHSILGVSATADVKEVKRAYRKLALQFHPDVCKSEEGHERFITLTQAYEMLLGRAEGKTDTNYASSSGWDFHDWYWNFRMQRSWEKQQRQAKAAADGGGDCGDEPAAEAGCGRRPPPHAHAGFKQPEARENLRSQLAGLRHRAAVRANRPAPAAAPSSSSSAASPVVTWSAASGCSMDAADAGAESPASASSSASSSWGPLPSWSYPWSWSWDDTLSESEDEQTDSGATASASAAAPAAASDLHHQYTHVYDTGSAAAAAAAAGSDGPAMSVHDGHLGTVVANHAVPFPNGGFSPSAAKQQQHQQQHQQQTSLQPQAHEPESEPEPFSNPFDKATHAQPHYQQQRRRFAADGATREAVSHQLTGLRRKAAIKGRRWGAAMEGDGL